METDSSCGAGKPMQLCVALFNSVVITELLILHGDTGGQCPGAIFVVRPAAQIYGVYVLTVSGSVKLLLLDF